VTVPMAGFVPDGRWGPRVLAAFSQPTGTSMFGAAAGTHRFRSGREVTVHGADCEMHAPLNENAAS